MQSIACNPLLETKSALRANLLATREAQGARADQDARGEALARRLMEAVARFPNTSCIGFYWPVAGEFDARDVLTVWLALDASRKAALPVVIAPRSPLVFHAWQSSAAMKRGRYGIPVPAEERVVVPDLLVIPCVGFDIDRYRLGYGGGYYDRTLADWPGDRAPATIGVAFESAKCDALPRGEFDLPLGAIVTESAVY
ncbi:MAG: 5-formyltetrahydrofolate cyclo-ligase [Caballeronia sp.]|uniref:5-formyltetrahydrofolate cyclo-ligase n=1 Tax=Caballeronia sp. TaxID=1931223 RepID=UPI002601A00D|nr:5-formyltetrahydrofolate cyclo-ligase [Caballeronia sp.]MDB5832998.1 5-formyltetrahydrofolate cyclo-ligase [Caballeronia sp.]